MDEVEILKDDKLYCIELQEKAEILIDVLNQAFTGTYTIGQKIIKEREAEA